MNNDTRQGVTEDLTVQSVNIFAGNPIYGEMPLLDFKSHDDGTGMYTVPSAMLREFNLARDALMRQQEAIVLYMLNTGQDLPWPFCNNLPVPQSDIQAAAMAVVAMTNASDLTARSQVLEPPTHVPDSSLLGLTETTTTFGPADIQDGATEIPKPKPKPPLKRDHRHSVAAK